MSRRAAATLALASSLVASRVADAGSFDDQGVFSPDPGAVAFVDFENEDPDDISSEDPLIVHDPAALEQHMVLELASFGSFNASVDLPRTDTAYRVSAWIRGGELLAQVAVFYPDNPHPSVDEVSLLYPTGRMTSDGWVEMANDEIAIDGTRLPQITVSVFAASAGQLDAIEFVPQRPLRADERAGGACTSPLDPGACGPAQTCSFSQCRHVGGWVPPIPADREDVAAYLRARVELLFGPHVHRDVDLPAARLAFDRMADATDKWSYWNGYLLGIRMLHDGHTTTSGVGDFSFENEKPLGICLIEGDADVSGSVAPSDPFYLDVLVSHVGPHRTLGLVPGDRIVAVDGRHPIGWARSLIEHHWGLSPISDRDTFAELAEQLRSLIPRYATHVDVVRCDPETLDCSEPERIDMRAVPTMLPEEPFTRVACDNRPLRHLANSPADHGGGGGVLHGLLVESDEVEAIHGAEWNSLYTTGSDGVGPGLSAAVASFEANARGVILDHRTGNGGTIVGPQILWEFMIPSRTVSVYFDRQRADDATPTLEEGLALFARGKALGLGDAGGSSNPTTMPVALLITRDVSASDWLPLGMKGAADNVRIFGPFGTNGAFSTRYGFGYWIGMSTTIASGDTLDPAGRTLNGHGVEPDEVVLPLQSDLLQGRDTVHAAALAWVRQELAE